MKSLTCIGVLLFLSILRFGILALSNSNDGEGVQTGGILSGPIIHSKITAEHHESIDGNDDWDSKYFLDGAHAQDPSKPITPMKAAVERNKSEDDDDWDAKYFLDSTHAQDPPKPIIPLKAAVERNKSDDNDDWDAKYFSGGTDSVSPELNVPLRVTVKHGKIEDDNSENDSDEKYFAEGTHARNPPKVNVLVKNTTELAEGHNDTGDDWDAKYFTPGTDMVEVLNETFYLEITPAVHGEDNDTDSGRSSDSQEDALGGNIVNSSVHLSNEPGRNETDDNSDWELRYFPDKPYPVHISIFSDNHMFLVDSICDNGKDHLSVDWDNSMFDYSCFEDYYGADYQIQPVIHKDLIPLYYRPAQICMNTKIEYSSTIPTFGNYREVWAKYGEYKFVPPQRWLHNLAHGAVVMLYHPCAHPTLVNQLRLCVTSNVQRYVITPYKHLSKHRPLVLVTWGWYLSMNTVDVGLATQFIKEHAFHAPRDIAEDGHYDYLLLRDAVSFLALVGLVQSS